MIADEQLARVAHAIIEGSAGLRAADHAREFMTANWSDALRSAQAAIAAMQPDWRPIETAPRDGTYILAIVAANDCRHLGHHAGRMFAIRHEGATDGSGYDMGWAVYPGYGGAPDNFFSAWTPLPAPPAGESV